MVGLGRSAVTVSLCVISWFWLAVVSYEAGLNCSGRAADNLAPQGSTAAAAYDPFSSPIEAIKTLPSSEAPAIQRLVHIRGKVIEFDLGKWLKVTDGTAMIRAVTGQKSALTNHMLVEVVGRLTPSSAGVELTEARYRRLGFGLDTPPEQTNLAVRASLSGPLLPVLREARAVRRLDGASVVQGYPVVLHGVITYFDSGNNDCFVQDDSGGIWVDNANQELDLAIGQFVEVDGYSRIGYAPSIAQPRFRVLGTRKLPSAERTTLSRMLTGHDDSQWVKVAGLVRGIARADDKVLLDLELEHGGRLKASMLEPESQALMQVEGSRVEVSGVCSALLNNKQQMNGVKLLVPDAHQLTVLARPPANLFAVPLRPIRELMRYQPQENEQHYVRVRGTVILVRLGRYLYLQDASDGLYVEARNPVDLQAGDTVDAVGFPSVRDYTPMLEGAVCKRVGHGSVRSAITTSIEAASNGDFDGELIRIRAVLLEQKSDQADQIITLGDGERVFDAILEKRGPANSRVRLRNGSLLEVTGICSVQVNENREPKAFRMLLRSPEDVVVLRTSTAWLIAYASRLVGMLTLVSLAAIAWVLLLRRRVRQQTELVRQKLLAETALESRYRELVENASDLIFTMDFTGKCLSMNKAASEAVGCAQDETTGLVVFDLVAPEHQERTRMMLDRIRAGEPPGTTELDVLNRTGSRLTLELSARVLLQAGKPIGLECIARNITERKRAEQDKALLESQLRQAQKLEAIGTLAGGIAHDFNNILGIIIPYADLAKLDAIGNPSVQDSLSEVIKAANRAKDLVKQILTFSRLTKYERKAIQLQAVIKEVLKLLRSTIPSTIEIVDKLDSDAPQVLADPVQIHQVVVNLCTNAAHAMRGKIGRLEVELKPFLPPAEFLQRHPSMRASRYARLIVRDTGHGMDGETLKRIFEPFFTTKGPGEGTGLGLAVVHGIVQEHEGIICVSSQPGVGTQFDLYFPACDVAVAPTDKEVHQPEIPRGQGERILFVDDEKHLVSIARTMLNRHGYAVTTQDSPLEALMEFRRNPEGYDLVITDLTMPKMTGLELAREIHEIRPDVPILLATGFSGAWTEEDLKRQGVTRLILKPVTPSVLSQAVHSALHARMSSTTFPATSVSRNRRP